MDRQTKLRESHERLIKECFPNEKANIGWSTDDNYICSKIYTTPRKFVTSSLERDSICHEVSDN
jgi:hypothetical protein